MKIDLSLIKKINKDFGSFSKPQDFYLNSFIKDIFSGNYYWNTFLQYCKKHKDICDYIEKISIITDSEKLILGASNGYFVNLTKEFKEIYKNITETTLFINVCFYLIEKELQNKQLEFDF